MFKPILVALLIAVTGTSASASSNPQLDSLVENGLTHYGLHADVSKLDNLTVARLHMTMSSRKSDAYKRRELKVILREAKLKRPL